ncbi:phosphotransferase system HPr (HPr) family protein [Thermanaerovibrio velox DSM 12556]|uniref:Phosphotransferase system HPr (HPr) family protein n=1 Tax=Thermanaerovibrio velox DSM 12556 TaxID=926567 RepID=H0UNJ5_9BACT|nr:HPr family phosphocarrier protein [Thermanaerovibrio velox]EHM09402.1 phosphotransferase system HPr (HPr) family protein [Thermanaerovibrio velox DSM 12556]
MPSIEVVVKNPHGLHARPAALFVQKASSFPCAVKVTKKDRTVDAKSILGIMSLGIEPGETIRIEAEGEGAEEALKALQEVAEDTSV